MRDNYLWSVDCFVYCDTFEKGGEVQEMEQALSRCQKIKDVKDLSQLPVVLCRTKADLNLPFKDSRKVIGFAKANGYPLISCSAKTRTNVDLVFHTACRVAKSKRNSPVRVKHKKKD